MITTLFEDEHTLVISKPAQLLVHKSKATAVDEPTVIDWTLETRGLRVSAVHRLDRATSGVLLLAKSSEATAFYGRQFEERRVEKTYIAVTRGHIESQTIDYPLKHLERPDVIQPAITRVVTRLKGTLPYPVGRYPESRNSLVELSPLTGRRHQLRRHLKHVFHPIIGDTAYGHGIHNQLFRSQLNCHRLLLHHSCLSFELFKSERVSIEAPFDESFQRVIDRLAQFA